jgi:hypothetical protein
MADNSKEQTETKEFSLPQEAIDDSIQARADYNIEALNSGVFWATSSSYLEGEISDWWSETRDQDLEAFYKQEGNDILQGCVSSFVKKFKAMNWLIEGPEQIVKPQQELLSFAEFGKSWGELLSKTIESYSIYDKGAFWEIIGTGKLDAPIDKVTGIAHLDSRYCRLTGDLEFPVVYFSTKNKKPHKLHATRVAHMSDMPSPNVEMNDIGFCATSRIIGSSSVLLKLNRYKNEKLSDLPPAGILFLNNILPNRWKAAKENYNSERRQHGEQYWKSVMTLFGIDPSKPATGDFISFANLPDHFNELQTTETYLKILSLAFGIDVREIWPMSQSILGSGKESEIQHQKAKGKGIGEIISMLERVVNWKVIVSSCEFKFDFQDDEEDRMRAEINEIKTQTIMRMFKQVTMGPGESVQEGSLPVASRIEVRQMLADNVDYFMEQFLTIDLTDEIGLTDTQKEQFFGDKVIINRKGQIKKKRLVEVEKHHGTMNKLLGDIEQNYRDGLISLDDVIEFKLSDELDQRIN